jgi:hypothetical protein
MTHKIVVSLLEFNKMADSNKKNRYILGVLFILLFCLNINVIANKENNTQVKNNKYPYLICRTCEPAPGQYGVEWVCIDGPEPYCPFTLPCGYGFC